MKILNVPTSSITDVKKSPMDVFKKADQENSGVYVFNRDKVAGVMLTQDQYESINQKIDNLYDQIVELTVHYRLLNEEVETYSDEEVCGKIANQKPVIDKNDGWE